MSNRSKCYLSIFAVVCFLIYKLQGERPGFVLGVSIGAFFGIIFACAILKALGFLD